MAWVARIPRGPTAEDLQHGRGEVSGRDAKWLVGHIEAGTKVEVYYAGELFTVRTVAEWNALPSEGLQACAALELGGLCKGCDEYRYGDGESKFGTYLDDRAFSDIEEAALIALRVAARLR